MWRERLITPFVLFHSLRELWIDYFGKSDQNKQKGRSPKNPKKNPFSPLSPLSPRRRSGASLAGVRLVFSIHQILGSLILRRRGRAIVGKILYYLGKNDEIAAELDDDHGDGSYGIQLVEWHQRIYFLAGSDFLLSLCCICASLRRCFGLSLSFASLPHPSKLICYVWLWFCIWLLIE